MKERRQKGFNQTPNFAKQDKASAKKLVSGFTLVEVMIAIGLFSVIMIVGISALISVHENQRKVKTMREAIDGLSFIMEDMTRQIRIGANYRCLNDENDINNITAIEEVQDGTGCIGIAFEPYDSPFPGPPNDHFDQVIYYLCEEDGVTGVCKYDYTQQVVLELTAKNILIDPDRSEFDIYGSPPGGDQPSATFRLSGLVEQGSVSTEFNLQTTVSQRLLDYAN